MSAASSLTARLEGRLRTSRARRSRPWRLPLSLGLHLAVLLLLLLGPRPKPPPEPMLASPVAMMFEPPRESRRAAPQPSRETSLPSPPPAPLPMPPPPPPAAPAAVPVRSPPPVETEQAQAEPLQAEPPVPPAQAASSNPPAPPVPAPNRGPPPVAPALPQPAPPPPGSERRMAAVVPLRLSPPAATAVPHKSTPSHRRAQTAFPAPMQFSLGRPLGRPSGRPEARTAPSDRMRPASYGPAEPGSLSYGQFAEVVSGHVDPSWLDQLHQWWQQHGYYPEQAAANGEDGTVIIQIVVDRYGHVRSVQRDMGSGSQWLDMAAEAVFRGAHLPPLPPDTQDRTITLNLNIMYVLLGR